MTLLGLREGAEVRLRRATMMGSHSCGLTTIVFVAMYVQRRPVSFDGAFNNVETHTKTSTLVEILISMTIVRLFVGSEKVLLLMAPLIYCKRGKAAESS